MKTVLVLLELNAEQKARLEALGEDCCFCYGSASATQEQLAEADIIIGNPRPEALAASPRLRFLQLASSGADNYVQPGVLQPDTVLASATGAYGQSVAEHAFAVTWCLLKKLHLYRDQQTAARWADCGTVGTLAGATVAVVGLGDIGLHYARLAHAVGARVIGVKRRESACPEGVDELVLTAELDAALARADVVCAFLPGTGETYHLFDDARFANMKPGSLFINCGRGTALDAEALCHALESGRLAAAGTDVTEAEPLPAEHPLWRQKNLLLTPHVSGGTHLPVTFERIFAICLNNFAAFLAGGELQSEIDRATGYKK